MHQTALSVSVGKDEQPRRCLRDPAKSFAAETRAGDSNFLVQLPSGLLNRCEFGLDFGHEQCPRPPVASEHVDRATFAIHRVRDLDRHLPPRVAQGRGSGANECRMPLVHEPIERASLPHHHPLETGVDRGKDPSDCLE